MSKTPKPTPEQEAAFNSNSASRPIVVDSGYSISEYGLTKREWLAGLAMQGLCGCPDSINWKATQIATHAVEQADELLLALATPQTKKEME